MAKSNGNGKQKSGERIAIVAGLRTPFAKSGTAYRDMSALDLGRTVVSEILARSELAHRRPGRSRCFRWY